LRLAAAAREGGREEGREGEEEEEEEEEGRCGPCRLRIVRM